MRTFPFPDRIESREELKSDILYEKIPPEKHAEIADLAWNRGVFAAKAMLNRYPGQEIGQIAAAEGLSIRRMDQDHVVGAVRYFSEYCSGRREVTLYVKSVQLWAQANHLGLKAAEDLILSHEMYHHLECTSLGLTSDLYRVPRIQIGTVRIGKSGIRALSEIGAHGFSHTYYESRALWSHSGGEPIQNGSVDAALCNIK